MPEEKLGRPAACDGHVDVFTGEGLAYLTESYNRIAHNIFSSVYHALRRSRIIEWRAQA